MFPNVVRFMAVSTVFVLCVVKRLDLLKAQRRKREHTGGGDPELLGKRLKECYR